MVNNEDEYLMLSGIQHFQFCKRQWALIHLEQQWAENVRTLEGQYIHRNADQPFTKEKRGEKIIVRAMAIKSHTLKFSGICDVVEFIAQENGVELQGVSGKYIPYPVEYKRGKPKKGAEDIVQLAAQAICLEEMLVCSVDKGFIYYDEIKHRIEVEITRSLKNEVRAIAEEMHQYYTRQHTPKVKTGKFCNSCSLQHICMPQILNKHSVRSYVEGRLFE